jgi:tetratricopeptide (TPR) repeat protein
VPSDAASDQHASSDGYVQRAELLADLGRYDEAVTELRYALALESGNAQAFTVLARVHLAADQPAEALAAADAAGAAAPGLVYPLVARGLALVDLRRFAEAAQTADQILALGAADPYAQRSAAGILAESRNGQQALDAAWRGVELAPGEAQAHLMLGLVAARLGLFDLAERAYRQALELDPELAEARHDIGVARLEQRRYAALLEDLAETVAVEPGQARATRTIGDGLARLVLYGAGYSIVAVVLVAFLAAGNGAISRIGAALMAIAGAVLVWRFAARVPGLVNSILPDLLRRDRALAFSVYAVAASPCLILVYALVGTPWPLVLAIGATAVAELAVLRRARD